MIDNLCPPAILYLGFSLTQITIDTFKGFYNTAFFKSIVMIFFTLILIHFLGKNFERLGDVIQAAAEVFNDKFLYLLEFKNVISS